MQIQPQAAFQTVVLREHDALLALFEVRAKIKSRGYGEFGDGHIAGEQCGGRCARQPEVGIGGGTDAWGIAEAYSLGGRAEIELQGAARVTRRTRQHNCAAAGRTAQLFDLNAVAVEEQNSV